MNERNTPFGTDDDVWLAAANVLHLAATTTGETRKHHLFESLGIAIDFLGDERIDEVVNREWFGDRSYIEAMLVLADLVHWAGALHLAAIMLDDLATAAPDLSVVEQGRLLALRARVDWKLGRLDEAAQRYGYIADIGKKARSAELETRAEVGLVAVAQLRGNLPELRKHATRASELADQHGYSNLARLAYQGFTIAAAKGREYDEALIAGWKVVKLSDGNPLLEAEALQNLGQLMLEAGHTAVARASFAAVMTREAPARVLLPALGGLALASAQLASEATVEWSVREVWRAQNASVPRYELAVALLECAVALGTLGRYDEADRYKGATEVIARADGFHELVYRAASLDRVPAAPPTTPPSLRPRAAAVARELSALAPEQLPAHVVFESAPA